MDDVSLLHQLALLELLQTQLRVEVLDSIFLYIMCVGGGGGRGCMGVGGGPGVERVDYMVRGSRYTMS